jgi:putative endonuclease
MTRLAVIPRPPQAAEGSLYCSNETANRATIPAYFVYMMSNTSRSVLYTGVTNSLLRRVVQHREGRASDFTARYHCNRLVYFDPFRGVANAIAREKEIKGWWREKKNHLIAKTNPRWIDLSASVLGLGPAPKTKWIER